MSKIKRLNPDYSGGIPLPVGDRYYAQDLGRDFHSILDFQSTMMRAVINLTPQLLRGGICSKGTGWDDMNITPAFGLTGYEVDTPDDFSSLPPTVQQEDILAIIVESIQQTDFDLSATGTLDGVTVNYVKLTYKEDDGASRNRAKKSGSYVYEKEPSFEIIVNSTVPTIYDCLLCSFVGDGASVLTITQEPPYLKYEVSVSANTTIEVGNSMEIKINSDVSGGDNTITLQDGSIDGQRFEVPSDGANFTYVKGTGLFLGGGSSGIPISDGLKLSGRWDESLSKWIADNEITADYDPDASNNIKKTSLGKMILTHRATTTTISTTATGSVFFTNASQAFPENFANTNYIIKPSVSRVAGAIWAGGTLNEVVGGLSIQIIGSTNSSSGKLRTEIKGDY